jgi:glycosyltransferase involved in cell wall biosynthesis
MAAHLNPAVAIFPWGDVIEDFLDPIGLTLHDFAERMRGGWLFGYVAALQSVGRRPVIVCASSRVGEPTCLAHTATGAPVWAVPGRALGPDRRPWRRSVRQWRNTPWRGFAEVLRRERCAAILVQDYEHPRFDSLALLATALRLPLYATFQGGDVTLSELEAAARRWSLSRCRGLVVASARERSRLATRYPRVAGRIAPIPNPLDVGEWRASPRLQARSKLGLPQDQFIAVSHGRIDIRRKGLDVLIEGWCRFSAEHPDARLVLLGSGQDHAEFRRMLADCGATNVSWRDEYVTDRPHLRRWLSAADAYVIASRTEGMPVAPLEAMACGLPVVASRAHGLPDIFETGEGSGGILVPCDDVAALAHGLTRLAASPELRERLGRSARLRIEQHFAVDAVGRQLDELLRQRAA